MDNIYKLVDCIPVDCLALAVLGQSLAAGLGCDENSIPYDHRRRVDPVARGVRPSDLSGLGVQGVHVLVAATEHSKLLRNCS